MLPLPFQRFDIKTQLGPGEVLGRLHAPPPAAGRGGEAHAGSEEPPARGEHDRTRHIAFASTPALLIGVTHVARGHGGAAVRVSILPGPLFWLGSGIACIYVILGLSLGEPSDLVSLPGVIFPIGLAAALVYSCWEAEGVRRLIGRTLTDPGSSRKAGWPVLRFNGPRSPGSKGVLDGVLILACLLPAGSAPFLMGQPELDRIQLSIWTAGRGFAMTVTGCMAVVAAGWGLLFLVLRKRMRSAFTVCIFLLAGIAGALWTFALITQLNWRLDSAAGEPIQIEVADKFLVKGERWRKRSSRPGTRSTWYYLALSVPEGLRNHSLVGLSGESFQRYSVGQKIQVVKHPGYFGLPWYEFAGAIPWASDANLKYYSAIHAIQGRFSRDSPHRRELEQYGVEIQEL